MWRVGKTLQVGEQYNTAAQKIFLYNLSIPDSPSVVIVNEEQLARLKTHFRRRHAATSGFWLPPRRLRPVRRERSDYRGDPRPQSRDDRCGCQEVRLRLGKAKSLRAQPNGEALITDGPYLETKDHVGGFWILETADVDEAMAWARKCAKAARL